MAFIYDLTDTWNAGGTTFNAIKMNVTDSASAAASRLISLQVGGAERFGVDKAGIGTFASVIRAAGGSTSAPAFSFGSDTNTGMWSPSSDAIAFSTAGSERLRVDSSGNVGVGIDNASAGRIVVRTASTTGKAFIADNTANTGFVVDFTPNITSIGNDFNNPLVLLTNNTERMRITPAGDVGIGTSSPGARLDVAGGDIYVRTGGRVLTDTVQGYSGLTTPLALGAAQTVTISTASTERMRIDSAGNLGLGVTPSAWAGGFKVFALGGNNIWSTNAPNTLYLSQNNYFDGVFRYQASGLAASRLEMATGAFQFFTAPSGTAGNAITFTQAMTLTASAELILDSGSGGGRLTFVTGNAINSFLSTTTGFGAYNPTRVIASDIRFETGSSPSERMRVTAAGDVGIGTSSPNNRLQSAFPSISIPTSVPAAGAGAHGLAVGALGFGLAAGALTSGNAYLQATRWDGSAINYDLLLQPNGGNVGIGTSSPDIFGRGYTRTVGINSSGTTVLQINGTTYGAVDFGFNGTRTGTLLAETAGFYLQTTTSAPLVLGTNNTERMRIDSSGNLLVGTTSGALFARILAESASVGGNFASNNTAGSGTRYHCVFYENGTERGSITSNGSSTSYNTSSDARLKHEIVDAPDAADLIDAIKVRSFKWNADNSEQRYGMVAQELLEVAPEAVSVPADEDQMMGVDYSKLVPMLIKEVQSLRARVAQLEGN